MVGGGNKKMRLVHHELSRNFLGWKEGTHTLEIQFRGTRDELLKKLKEEIELDLIKNA